MSISSSTFFMVQLSHPYMTTGKTIALARQTFVGKVTSLLFNMLSRCNSFSPNEQGSFNFMAAVTACSDFGGQENKVLQSIIFEDLNSSTGIPSSPLAFFVVMLPKAHLTVCKRKLVFKNQYFRILFYLEKT